MTPADLTLLKLAAKALGCEFKLIAGQPRLKRNGWCAWNPLKGDIDCARMEANLSITVEWNDAEQEVCASYNPGSFICVPYGDNKQAARREASTRAAAEIGKEMK
jgi:hypothetical protein